MHVTLPYSLLRTPLTTCRKLLIQPLAWALFFLSPVLNVFRVDVIDQRLVWLGHSYPLVPSTAGYIPIVFYASVILIGVASALWGRLFCGWVCPHHTMTEWTRPLRAMLGLEAPLMWLKKLTPRFKAVPWVLPSVAVVLCLAWAGLLSFLLASYFVAPGWIVEQWVTGGHFKTVLMLVMGLFSLVGLFLLLCGFNFCRYACPYGLSQAISAYAAGKWAPMEIRMKDDSQQHSVCKGCVGCQAACPVDLDPRTFAAKGAKLGYFEGCFNCGACVDACSVIQLNKPDKPAGLLQFKLLPVLAKPNKV